MLRLACTLGVVLGALGCAQLPASFHCTRAEQCTHQGQAGFCESSGSCSFADDGCPSHRRYAEFAEASLANQCAAVASIGAYFLGGDSLVGQNATLHLGRYRQVVIPAWQGGVIAEIKAENPNTRVLMTTSAMEVEMSCTTSPGQPCRTGLGGGDITDQAWLLKDATGNPVERAGVPGYHLADVGSPGYQTRWLENVTAAASAAGFDGVSLDNTLAQVSAWSGGVFPAKYSTDAAWETAMAGFVDAVGPALKARGLFVSAVAVKSGANDGSEVVAWWRRLAPSVDALHLNYFEQNPNQFSQVFDQDHLAWTGYWQEWLSVAGAAEDAGASFSALIGASAGDTTLMTYARASYLMAVNDTRGAFFCDLSPDPWNVAWTFDVGEPSSAREPVGVGFKRNCSLGVALINPSGSAPQTFALGGTFYQPDGAAVSSVTLQPRTAALLRSSP